MISRTVCPLCTHTPVNASSKDATCDPCRSNPKMFPVNYRRTGRSE